jgi:predicted metal-dependent phosphoesterase TrpH
MIDLHLHTTASDGSSTPGLLVREVIEAGLTTIAITDHDTVDGFRDARALAAGAGLACVAGIEITAVHDGHDVHVLGYFIDPDHAELAAFLTRQLDDRRRRLHEMAERLSELGMPIDARALEAEAKRESRRALGRPLLAKALVGGGYVRDIREAFDKYLAIGRPGFITRVGATPPEVAALIRRAGGLASIAHPGKLDEAIVNALPDTAFDAIEVYHPDHGPADVARFRAMADARGLGVTGGSDFHGRASGRQGALGAVALPQDDYDRLVERAGRRRAHV